MSDKRYLRDTDVVHMRRGVKNNRTGNSDYGLCSVAECIEQGWFDSHGGTMVWFAELQSDHPRYEHCEPNVLHDGRRPYVELDG